MIRAAIVVLFASILVGPLFGQSLANSAGLKGLPVNQWKERPTSGWKGKTSYGQVLEHGFASTGDQGILVWDAFDTIGAVRLRRFDPATDAWSDLATAALDPAFVEFSSGRKSDGNLHGMQLCYDADRKTLVGLTSTDLNGAARTVEFHLQTMKASGVRPKPSPPTVTAASLCYDPVNKEVVLATGGFSPVGGTDGTWLYDGIKQSWRRLQGPKDVEEVRLPLEKVRERLVTLCWLTWKNLEFWATGRDKALDDRAKADALAKESAQLVSVIKQLAEAATCNANTAEHAYHQERLAAASKLLNDAAALLASAEGKLRAANPEDLEALYRAKLAPTQEAIEQALAELATSPEPRMSARLVYDAKNRLIICFGGDGQRCTFGDTWVYHCAGRWWERRRPKTHPAPNAARAMTYDPRTGLVVLLHRKQLPSGTVAQMMWSYDAAKNDWRRLNMAAPADAFWLEHSGPAGCLVAFNFGLNRAWLFRLDPASIPLPKGEQREAAPKETPEIAWVPTTGDYVLRDAATVADLKKWQAEMGQWVKDVPSNTWMPAPTHGNGRPNSGRTWSSVVYDPQRHQLYYRDGGHGSYHGADTDHYDLPTGRWFRSDRRDLPPWPMGTYFGWGRAFSNAPWAIHNYKYSLWYNPLRQRLQREIGQSGIFEGIEKGRSVLEYDPDTGQWSRELHVLPGAVQGMIGGPIIPGLPDAMACLNNFTRYGTKNGEGWIETAAGAKQWSNLGMLPRAWDDHSWCWFYDPPRKRILYYGGPKGKHQLFALDVTAAAPKWQEIAIKGADGSLPLSSREIAYVPRHDVFLMASAAGPQQQAPLEDLIWSFEPGAGVFQRLKLAKQPTVVVRQGGGVSEGLQYDPAADLCYFIQAAAGAPQLLAFRFVPAK